MDTSFVLPIIRRALSTEVPGLHFSPPLKRAILIVALKHEFSMKKNSRKKAPFSEAF